MSFLNVLSASTAILSIAAFPAFADTLPAPTGEVILTVSGELAHETRDAAPGTVTLDLEMLKAMDTKVFTTSTIWLEGDIEFTGVSLMDVLAYAGATGGSIGAVASNDYKVDIPAGGLDADAPIVAYLMDGAEMSARGKGPLWIVYPYDINPKYRTEVVYSRSIWQLDRIVSGN